MIGQSRRSCPENLVPTHPDSTASHVFAEKWSASKSRISRRFYCAGAVWTAHEPATYACATSNFVLDRHARCRGSPGIVDGAAGAL